jgi:hypothetical protein
MGKPSVVAGWKGAKFGSVDFSKYVTAWEDTRDRSGPIHEYIKRDGGEAEDMGRKPHRAVVHLAYVGPGWMDAFIALQSIIDDNPIQTLTHPIYGPMMAYANMSSGRMDVENSPNLYDVAITFIESQVDTNLPLTTDVSSQGPAARQQAVSNAAAAFAAAAAQYSTAASAVAAATSSATSYATAAVNAAVNQTPDATVPQLLGAAQQTLSDAIAAIKLDPNAAPGYVDPAVAAGELLYDTLAQVDDSVRGLRPTLYKYTVTRRSHITSLLCQFYGSLEGPRREAEFLANNPTLPDPGFIREGTEVWLAAATAQR